MDKDYVSACASFKWLQEQWKPRSGDMIFMFDEAQVLVRETSVDGYWQVTTPEGGSKLFTADDFIKEKSIYLPRLDTLIELMGDSFMELRRIRKDLFLCYFFDGEEECSEEGETHKLVCLAALKKIKEENAKS